ncbi:MAG: thioredoxin family protein [Chrysiogenia bacterium]
MNQGPVHGKSDHVVVLADPHDISPYFAKDRKTVILFEMTLCPFCRMFQSRFLDFAAACSRDHDFLRVKLDDHGNPLWERYQIETVPTVMVFSNGQIQSRLDSIPLRGISRKKWGEFQEKIQLPGSIG